MTDLKLPSAKKPILVIEDDHDTRVSIRGVLESEGYHIYTATNGMDAFNLLDKIPTPGLIFLDLVMPIMNGWEFFSALKKDPSRAHIPVAVVTVIPEKALGLDAMSVLEKPLDLEALAQVAHQACN